MKKFNIQNSACTETQGYTLIELVVVIGLAAILLLTAVALFFTTFVGGGKTASGEYAKQAGGQVLSQMTFTIRNARQIVANKDTPSSVCAANMKSISVENQDGTITSYWTKAGKLEATVNGVDSDMAPTDLTIPSTGLLQFSCSPSSYGQSGWDGSPPIVTMSFTLEKNAAGSARDKVSIPFSASITLRNN